MIHAYDSNMLLGHAQQNLGRMLDYGINEMCCSLRTFYDRFLQSFISEKFAYGDDSVILGRSGIELAYELFPENVPADPASVSIPVNRSREYWAGWILAYYQWYTGLKFREIDEFAPIEKIMEMYEPYHEMDPLQSVDYLNERYKRKHPDTRLKEMRLRSGYSQKYLSELSGVPLRTIQQYEQRQKNINCAKVDYLVRMSKAMGCSIEMLIEKI